ncbi:nuclear transport factor 2 family protein [Acuticoccus kandeliae]|uniref:nuclear transport factor 2 family protein n=1 Tax=Acuticoccus kandeliae TaxID=2073160 RepID=UPI000D3E5DE8|nr:nuclear transport factor 2 family protein [Acuticoccus kandeliae]
MPDPLATLLARQAISDVLIAYCRHLDRMDLPAIGALFTEDCAVIYADAPAFRSDGRAALEQSLQRMWRWRRTAHHLSNVTIAFPADDEAHTESYVFAWHEGADGGTATVFGRYLDVLVRDGSGVWRIKERRMDMNGADSGFKVPLPQAPRHAPPPGWKSPV